MTSTEVILYLVHELRMLDVLPRLMMRRQIGS